MNKPENYVISWYSLLTGKTGQGKTRFNKSRANHECSRLNREFSETIRHEPMEVKND